MSMQAPAVPRIGRYELWKVAHAAVGLVGVGGLMFLIPLAVVEQGGTPADAGAVVALAGALGLLGPYFGSLADRFGIHRAMQVTSLLLFAGAALVFAIAEQELTWLVGAAFLGIGMAGLTVVNATMVVGAGFDERTQAGNLALLQLSLPVGQVLGLALIAGMSVMGFGIPVMFLVLAGIATLFAIFVGMVNRGPAARLTPFAPGMAHADDPSTAKPSVTLRDIFISPFGLLLLVTLLLMMSASAIESQYPNYMQSAFAIDPGVSAGALSLIVLVTVPFFVLAGRWTAKAGPRGPLLTSALLRAGAGVVLLMLPQEAGFLALVVFGIIMVAYPLFELSAATLAARTSPIGDGPGQGAVGAALALGAMLAAIVAGWLAEQFGFSSLAAITVVTASIALILGLALRGTSSKVTR